MHGGNEGFSSFCHFALPSSFRVGSAGRHSVESPALGNFLGSVSHGNAHDRVLSGVGVNQGCGGGGGPVTTPVELAPCWQAAENAHHHRVEFFPQGDIARSGLVEDGLSRGSTAKHGRLSVGCSIEPEQLQGLSAVPTCHWATYRCSVCEYRASRKKVVRPVTRAALTSCAMLRARWTDSGAITCGVARVCAVSSAFNYGLQIDGSRHLSVDRRNHGV